MANRVRKTIVQRKNDPYIYLFVAGEWYCYNPEEALLGSGAMGDVYRGYRCKTGEMVAVKRVKDYYANNVSTNRFCHHDHDSDNNNCKNR